MATRRSANILAKHPAGADHAVVTVSGGGHTFRARPCGECPWRKDLVGTFPPEAFRLSANTGAEHVYAEEALKQGLPGDGETTLNKKFNEVSHTFGCHSAGVERPQTCAGYIVSGKDSLSWRIAVAVGKFDPTRVSDDGIELFGSYYDMAVANGVSPDDPALAACRPWRSPHV